MSIVDFTPVTGIAGGLLIGLGASLLLWLNGRIAGISGIVNGSVAAPGRESVWRWLFLLGLIAGAAVEVWISPRTRGFQQPLPWPAVLVAGLLVGFGTRLGNGCTSGHGVCGLGRLSPRSLAAVVTFLVTGALTVFVVRHLWGAP